jgi:hypothetical protein
MILYYPKTSTSINALAKGYLSGETITRKEAFRAAKYVIKLTNKVNNMELSYKRRWEVR